MRRLFVLVLLTPLTGCSNAPVAGFLDCVSPTKGGGSGRGGDQPAVPDVRPPASSPDNLPPAALPVPPVGPAPQ